MRYLFFILALAFAATAGALFEENSFIAFIFILAAIFTFELALDEGDPK